MFAAASRTTAEAGKLPVSLRGLVRTEDLVHTYSATLFSHDSQGSPAARDVEGLWGITLSKKVIRRKTTTTWYHLYVESEKAELRKTEGWGWRDGGI